MLVVLLGIDVVYLVPVEVVKQVVVTEAPCISTSHTAGLMLTVLLISSTDR